MPSLKDLRIRIASVKSTQRITSAMKMVAAAKLRRAQEQAELARPFAERMERMMRSLAAAVAGQHGAPPLLAGTGREDSYLIVVVTSDRGLCGPFNASVVRHTRGRVIRPLLDEGKTVKLLCVGRKGRDLLRREFEQLIVDTIEEVARPALRFEAASAIAGRLTGMFEDGGFDVCTVIYNRFKSALTQIVTEQQLVPFPLAEAETEAEPAAVKAVYEFEPDEVEILAELLPRNLAVQLFRALLESTASEHGARMTAMDSATRNAGEMIDKLTLLYNRSRQAAITKELIEIISGAEAV
ncbi:MAG: F0F1 ATP synthase subunit gamma [Kiloniellales bacterium]